MGDPKRKEFSLLSWIMEATWLLLFIATLRRTPVLLRRTVSRIVMTKREKKTKGQSA